MKSTPPFKRRIIKYNVFYCKDCNLGRKTNLDSMVCKKCEKEMENMGWFEGGAV
jgi:hypothetical protein